MYEYINGYNQQADWKTNRFKNYPEFLKDLKKAIEDEKSAIEFYSQLYKIAPTEIARFSVKTALDDEKEHYKKLTGLYKYLTGNNPQVKANPEEFTHFYEGLQKAFLDEIRAFEFYKELYLATNCEAIRDIIYSIQHDEMEHASLFNWTYTEIK